MHTALPIRRGLGVAIAALVALAALPAVANAAGCDSTTTTQTFAQFGDNAEYGLVAGGDFEGGSDDWSLAGSSVVNGNESFDVGSASDSQSLEIDARGVAASPSFCVSVAHPSFRFFARRTSGTWGVLTVKLRWTEKSGATHDTVVGTISGGTMNRWAPSPSFALATTLPLSGYGETLTTRLVFDPEDWGGDWAIDDVYVDPYRQR